jgi:hypothetical protein
MPKIRETTYVANPQNSRWLIAKSNFRRISQFIPKAPKLANSFHSDDMAGVNAL